MNGSQRVPEISQKIKMTGGSKLFDDAVTVQINMKENKNIEKVSNFRRFNSNQARVEKDRNQASMIFDTDDIDSGNGSKNSKMEVKITINMKQIEKHHREIDSYISPFSPSPDSIFLRIPLLPQDYARIEEARASLDQLVRKCHQMTPKIIPPNDAKNFLQNLRRIDVRCSALYPRPPAPGDKEKKSYRMCPCFEPEIEDIERLVVHYDGVFQAIKYFHNLDLFMEHQRAEKRNLFGLDCSDDEDDHFEDEEEYEHECRHHCTCNNEDEEDVKMGQDNDRKKLESKMIKKFEQKGFYYNAEKQRALLRESLQKLALNSGPGSGSGSGL
ncbi:uncharacterized protein CELE_C24H10.2 [Caenorhabditis elegans]|uniref:Uncharacterized protein n=1 Tax=Caenorhabditis elegans TaxID=6239 RepID=Q18134_CAEEL|nr:Uncharacterized protein CELE_C24H10.2 [Caenorhabditis elegans]CCD65554.1 Uncharacterized protein CELE_C24H10.2 [Caenorhabditis elegans]|eukprot:NP_508862.1 Uncharacterized protein CELE_C24H10.2 [Caenorhabditis elegans]